MKGQKRIGILGTGARAQSCRDELASDFNVVLTTTDPNALTEQADAGGLDVAALCDTEAGLAAQLELADTLLRRGVEVALLRPSVPHGIDGLGLVRKCIDGEPLVFLPVSRITHRPSVLKRLFDILFSAAVLGLGFLPCCLIALIIKLQDRGPVFFVQERVGAGGRHFRFIKFRTMWPDADRHREWYENRHGKEGHVFKLADDPRRTHIGRVLRRFSLDEVPQFLHALLGRMSVVGPRPPLPSEVEQYAPWQRMRLAGWFGLTGLWQVSGRSEVRNLDEIVLLDALYLHNHCPLLDLRIIFRTIRVMVSGRGAY